MKRATNLQGLLIDNLHIIFSSEKMQLSALPTIAQMAYAPDLKASFKFYLKYKEENIDRLRRSLALLIMTPKTYKYDVMQRLIDGCLGVIDSEKHIADVKLISALQQITHLNIANYGTAASYALTLEKNDIARLLHDAMEDEKEIDRKLSQIAEDTINPAANIVAG